MNNPIHQLDKGQSYFYQDNEHSGSNHFWSAQVCILKPSPAPLSIWVRHLLSKLCLVLLFKEDISDEIKAVNTWFFLLQRSFGNSSEPEYESRHAISDLSRGGSLGSNKVLMVQRPEGCLCVWKNSRIPENCEKSTVLLKNTEECFRVGKNTSVKLENHNLRCAAYFLYPVNIRIWS